MTGPTTTELVRRAWRQKNPVRSRHCDAAASRMSGSLWPLRSSTNVSKIAVRLVGAAGKSSVEAADVLAKCASMLAL